MWRFEELFDSNRSQFITFAKVGMIMKNNEELSRKLQNCTISMGPAKQLINIHRAMKGTLGHCRNSMEHLTGTAARYPTLRPVSLPALYPPHHWGFNLARWPTRQTRPPLSLLKGTNFATRHRISFAHLRYRHLMDNRKTLAYLYLVHRILHDNKCSKAISHRELFRPNSLPLCPFIGNIFPLVFFLVPLKIFDKCIGEFWNVTYWILSYNIYLTSNT